MCELPVVFQRQQGVDIGLNQHIQIRSHPGKRTYPEGVAQVADLAARLCGGSANRCLTEWVHNRSVVELRPNRLRRVSHLTLHGECIERALGAHHTKTREHPPVVWRALEGLGVTSSDLEMDLAKRSFAIGGEG